MNTINKMDYYLPTTMQPNNQAGQSIGMASDPMNTMSFQQMLFEHIQMAMQLNSQSNAMDGMSSAFMPNMFQMMEPNMGMFGMMNNQLNSYGSPMNQAFSAYQTQNNPLHNNGVNPYEALSGTGLIKQPPTNEFNHLIKQASEKYNVDENIIHAIIKMESNYDPSVKSHAGAVGLMQLMPVTAKEVGVTDRWNNAQNIDGGTHYFSKMLERQNGDLKLALASYNAGPGNVKKYGGIPPFKETQNYVRKIMDYLA